MDDYEHLVKLEAIKNSGPPLNAFRQVKACSQCPEGYLINFILEDLLHSKLFAGDDTGDPYGHIEFFNDACEAFQLNLFTKDEAKIILFGQTLSRGATVWYDKRVIEEKDTWETLSSAFIIKFYPGRRSPGAKVMITSFRNRPGESLYDGYKRFRGYLDNYPEHGLQPSLVLHTFYAGLSRGNRDELDVASNYSFQTFLVSTAWNLLENMHRESNVSYEYDEDENPINYESVEKFLRTGRKEDLNDNSHLGTNMINQISETYIDYLQGLDNPKYFTPPNPRVFMVLVKKDLSKKISEDNNITSILDTNHFPLHENNFQVSQETKTCSEEASSLDIDIGKNNVANKVEDYHYEPCNTNKVQEQEDEDDTASISDEEECDDECMQLEEMNLMDMWYQIEYCSETVKSIRRIKCYDCMTSGHFGYECTHDFDKFITSGTYKDGNDQELLEYIVYEGSHELLGRVAILSKEYRDNEDLERTYGIMEYIVNYSKEHLKENSLVKSRDRCKTKPPQINLLQDDREEEDEEKEKKDEDEKDEERMEELGEEIYEQNILEEVDSSAPPIAEEKVYTNETLPFSHTSCDPIFNSYLPKKHAIRYTMPTIRPPMNAGLLYETPFDRYLQKFNKVLLQQTDTLDTIKLIVQKEDNLEGITCSEKPSINHSSVRPNDMQPMIDLIPQHSHFKFDKRMFVVYKILMQTLLGAQLIRHIFKELLLKVMHKEIDKANKSLWKQRDNYPNQLPKTLGDLCKNDNENSITKYEYFAITKLSEKFRSSLLNTDIKIYMGCRSLIRIIWTAYSKNIVVYEIVFLQEPKLQVMLKRKKPPDRK